MRRGAWQRSCLCGWHLSFALIFRDRRLSARNSGSASPVETFHPRVSLLYTIFIWNMLYSEQLFLIYGVSISDREVYFNLSQGELNRQKPSTRRVNL